MPRAKDIIGEVKSSGRCEGVSEYTVLSLLSRTMGVLDTSTEGAIIVSQLL